MNETLEYIDRYFGGNLSSAEQSLFEKRCESDQAFAEQVAFYVSARAVVEADSDEERKKEFDGLYRRRSQKTTGVIRKMLPYLTIAAAACIILFLGWVFLFREPTSKQLADGYITEHFQNISPSLSSNKDSLEIGKMAFNKKDYKEAEKIFRSLSTDKNLNFEALEYLGILYLVTGEYDKAISHFETLASETSLHANFGKFYQAIALIKRDKKGDREKAKIILRQVIQEDLPGSKEAQEWIKEL